MTLRTHSEEHPWTPGRLRRMAWLPIPLLLTAIVAARLAGLTETYTSPLLLLTLSFTFYTLASLGTLYLIGRSFLGMGSPGLLLLECGVILWGLAGTVGDFVSHGDANVNVTIFNASILLAGLCHLAGTILSLRPQRVLRARPLWLAAVCAAALAALWLVAYAALRGWLPVFFIPGSGGTTVRHVVLSSAIAMFVLAAGLLKVSKRSERLPFASWYSLALLLLAVGLFGVMIQLSLGCVVNWLSRTAQWLGGVYLLCAAFASLHESQLPLLPPQKESTPAYYRDAVAVAMVVAAAALRLTFLAALGTQAPFVTFYPAVAFASLYGGLRAGLVATALSAACVDYFWITPAALFTMGQPSDWLAMLVFLFTGAMIAGVSDAMHRARVRANAAEKQALLASERAAAAEALHESRAKLEAALASMTDAIFISDKEGRFIDFNDAFAAFHRFKNKDECARTFAEYPDILDVFIGDGADGTPAPPDQWAVPRALKGETAANAEYTLRRKDTGETWVGSYSLAPIRDKDGAIAGSVVAARDITERKKIGAELQRQREWLRVTLGSIGDAVIATDTEGRVAFMNAVAETLTGWTQEEASGRPVTEVFHIVNEHTRQAVESPVDRVLAEGVIVGLANHTILIRKDGSEVPIDDSGAPIRDAGGTVLGVVLVFRDITERKQAEEAVSRSQQMLFELVERSPFGTYIVDSQFRIVQMNTSSRTIAFQNVRPLIGRDFAEAMNILWPEPVAAEIIGHFRHTLDCGEPYYSPRFTNPRHDIEIAESYEWELHRMTLPDGQYGVICYYYDSTKLREAEEKFAAAFANNPAAIVLTRFDDGLFLEVNDTWVAMNGYSREETIGRSAREMGIWPTPEAAARFVRELREKGFVHGWEQEFHKKSGEIFVAQLSAQALTMRGETVILSTLVDITERKRAETELRARTVQLEEANKELEAFSYSVSHDLRSPLRTINGYIRMILKTHGGTFDAEVVNRFNVIKSSTEMMGQLIDDLLNFSRLSRARVSMVELDMERLFQEVWKDMAENSGDGRLDLKIAALPPPARGDRSLIKQVLSNLLANAVKFSAGRDEVRIETGGYREGKECVYYVRDNGVGFDMQYHDKLFGVFSRLHAMEDFEGTGVGLAIVQRIVQRHGGRVWAEGKENEGATFYFTLPCHTQDAIIF